MNTTFELVIGNQAALLALLASSPAVGKIVEMHIVGNKGTLELQNCSSQALCDYLLGGKSCTSVELVAAEAVA